MRFLLLLVIPLSGCAAATIKSSPAEFLSSTSAMKVKSEVIKENLTRGLLQSGIFRIEATLITAPLIETRAIEIGTKQLDNAKTTADHVAVEKAAFLKDKTCFEIRVDSMRIAAGEFKYWNGKFEDSTGKFSDLDFTNVSGVGSVPSVFRGTDGIPFHNNSVACSKETPDLKPGFKVHFANKVESSSEAVTLVWLPFSTSSAPQ